MDFITFLKTYFNQISTICDIRQQSKVIYHISDILILIIIAMMCDYKNILTIQQFVEQNKSILYKHHLLENEKQIPSKNTFYRILDIVNWKQLKSISSILMYELPSEIQNLLKTNQISKIMDGKFIKGNKRNSIRAVNIVSLFDTALGIVIDQENVSSKDCEKYAMRKLVRSLNSNDILSIDAIACDSKTLKIFHKKNIQYVIALKGNNKTLFHRSKLLLSEDDIDSKLFHIKQASYVQNGKVISKEYFAAYINHKLGEALNIEHYKGCGIKFIVKEIKKTYLKRTNKTTTEIRFFVSNMVDIKKIAQIIQEHWAIESYHWLLDTVFVEDKSTIANKNSTTILNIFRKLILTLLKLNLFKIKGYSNQQILKMNNNNVHLFLSKLETISFT